MTFELFPCSSTIAGTIKAASGAAAIQTPRSPLGLPECREQDIGIARIENDINASGFGVLIKHLLPSLPAILRAENPPLFVIAKWMSERGDESDVRILGIHSQTPDSVSVAEADKLPGLARID